MNASPPLEIRVCGRFAILRDGIHQDIESIAGGKPMELLKLMIASGGRHIHITHLYQSLWEEADDEHAKAAFDGTLWRLRKQLDIHEALVLKSGFLSLNPEVLILDLWKFELLAQAVDELGRHHEYAAADSTAILATHLMETVKGPCFWLEPEYSWVFALQNKFRHKYLKTVLTLGRLLESHHIELAVRLYIAALEYYPEAEDVCVRLINCRVLQGLHAEAMMTYRCFQHILKDTLGKEPSAPLRQIIAMLLEHEKPV